MKIGIDGLAFYEARVDIRNLATILNFYEKSSRAVSSQNELGSMLSCDFAELLIKNELAEAFTDVKEAEAYIESTKVRQFRRVSRSRQKLMKSISKESLEEQGKSAVMTDTDRQAIQSLEK